MALLARVPEEHDPVIAVVVRGSYEACIGNFCGLGLVRL